MSPYLLIPLLPLIASLSLVFAAHRLGESGGKLASATIVGAFALSVGAFGHVIAAGPLSLPVYSMLSTGGFSIELSLYIDSLTALLLLLVTGVSALVHLYAARYMVGDPRYTRFFAVTTLFTVSMVMVVMSGNLLVTFMFWEVMGICSYLLISHAAERGSAAKAATKAFMVNAVADLGFALGLVVAVAVYGTLDIQQLLSQAAALDPTIDLGGWAGVSMPVQANTLIMLCLLMGALGKSAQVPFHVWLPFAVEAPTPVTPLTVTMVHVGPFLLIRLSPLLALSPTAMTVVLVLGATTALFGGLVALTQSDVKRRLAFSTISHIGFMFMTCGVGAFAAAVFHLLAHNSLRVFLFLSTGNSLGAVKPLAARPAEPAPPPSPPRAAPAALAVLGLTLVPAFVIFSGPYEALWNLNGLPSATVAFWIIGLVTVFVTALHLLRGIMNLFHDAPSLRDFTKASAGPVTPKLGSLAHIALFMVAALGVIAVLLGVWSWFGGFLAAALGQPPPVDVQTVLTPELWPRVVLPLGAAVGGLTVGMILHGRPKRAPTSWRKSLYVLLVNRLYIDQIYDAFLVRPTLGAARWLGLQIDRRIDAFVVGVTTSLTRSATWLQREISPRADRAPANASAWLTGQEKPAADDEAATGATVLAEALDGSLTAPARSTLQYHLMIIVGGLILVTGVFYFLQA